MVCQTLSKETSVCYLKSQNADVAFLQEVHLIDKAAVKLKRNWVGQVFYSCFSIQKHGVAILIRNKLNFVLLNQHEDE